MKLQSIYKLFTISLLLIISTECTFAQTATITVEENAKIPQLLALKKELEKDNKLSDSYTIQLFYGDLNEANNVLKKYRNSYSTWPASIEYETPNYKVWAGSFGSRIEADRALIEIHKHFSSAFILKPERKKPVK